MTYHEQSDDFDQRFLDALEKSHVHRTRWRLVAAALALIIVALIVGGIYIVQVRTDDNAASIRRSDAVNARAIHDNKQTIALIGRTACVNNNEIRREVIASWASTVDRARTMADAVLASPLASPLEKAAARRNLIAIEQFVAEQRRRLAPQKC